MLSRNLLRYRVRQGRVRPSFVDAAEPALLALAAALLATLSGGIGARREALEEALTAHLAAAPEVDALVGRGLVKLALDRTEFAAADEACGQRRLAQMARSTAILRALPAASGLAAYQAALAADPQIGEPARASLYDDLAGRRPLLAMRALSPLELLQRYNMALVQGLLMGSHRVTVNALCQDRLPLRRLLRWLKFCRLVAEVVPLAAGWQLIVTGPAAILTGSKKYGLQLATFLPVVPILHTFELHAEVQLRPGKTWQLQLSQTDPLVSWHGRALGQVPALVRALASRFADDAWQLEEDGLPRHVGAADMCVPDLCCHHVSGRRAYVELFHPWHAGPLLARLAQLQVRPDAALLLGIDRALLRRSAVAAAVAAAPACFLFSGYPTPRALRALLAAQSPAASDDQSAGVVQPSIC